MHKKRFVFPMIMVCLLLLLSVPAAAAESDAATAKDLSQYLTIEQSGHSGARSELIDSKLDETVSYAPFETIRLSWAKSPKTPAVLCIQWGVLPDRVQIRQTDANGRIVSDTYAEAVWDAIIPLSSDTTGVTIMANVTGMDIARLALFSDGTLPSPFFSWEEPPKGLDFLVIATHPDDDVLFMGGLIPIYGTERGYTGTVAYVTNPSRKRVNEAMLGLKEMGATYRPLFIGFQDIREVTKDRYTNRFLEETVTLAFVRLLREYRPLVVFTHAQDGEYGHWQHVIVSAAVCSAVRLVADPTYDPVSCEQFGTWEVRKCYLHQYPENTLEMDIRSPLLSLGGRNALEVAQAAYKKHASQQGGRHYVQSESDRNPIHQFGMEYGTVEAGNDVFDNIDPSLLASYQPPVPTEEPTPVPTEEATPAPSVPSTPEPELTTEPTPTPTNEPTHEPAVEQIEVSSVAVAESASPEPTITPERQATEEAKGNPTVWIVIALSAVLIVGCSLLLLLRRRRRR